jgi:hypothetical protein
MHMDAALPPTPDLELLTKPLTVNTMAAGSASSSSSDAGSDSKTKGESSDKGSSGDGKRSNAVVIGDLVVGTILGLVAVEAIKWVIDFPEPAPQIVREAARTPFAAEHVGADLDRVFYRPWTGTVSRHSAKVRIPVSGSKGTGVIHAQALFMPSTMQWEVISLQLAVPELADRLTDIMPPSPLDNTMPYIPSPNDPSALVWPAPGAPAPAASSAATAAAAAAPPASAAPAAVSAHNK